MWLSDVRCAHIVVQSLELFSSCTTEILYPWPTSDTIYKFKKNFIERIKTCSKKHVTMLLSFRYKLYSNLLKYFLKTCQLTLKQRRKSAICGICSYTNRYKYPCPKPRTVATFYSWRSDTDLNQDNFGLSVQFSV
jgi:hypothetical protein